MTKTQKGIVLFNDDEVRAIRAAYGSGKNVTQQMLAEQYKVNQSTISEILRHKTYKHVEG